MGVPADSPPVRPWTNGSGALDGFKATAFALAFYPLAWAAFHVATGGFGPLPLVGLIYWSGIWATALLLLALLITPAARITGWRRLIAVRRIVGVTALAYTLAHILVYFALYDWDSVFLARDMVTRPTLVVALVATAGLGVLGATSFDAAVRWIGPRGWRRLHRINYGASGLAVLHFLLSPGIFTLQYVMAGVILWAMLWRLLDRRERGGDPRALRALGLGTAALTVVLEAVWLRVYQGVDPGQTLLDNWTMPLGITAGWWVLAFGFSAPAFLKLSTRGASGQPARKP